MSTTTPAPAKTTAAPRPEVRIFSHSGLFYWWPVWAVGFVLAVLTYFQGTKMAVVPKGSMYHSKVFVPEDGRQVERAGIVFPEGERPPETEHPYLSISRTRAYGVLFTMVLLLVIVITNVPLRGMWSVLVIVMVVLLSIIFALAGWWDAILRTFSTLDIRINMGGYLFISILLLLLWALTFFLFDRQIYILFQPGQMKVCLEIGGGEKSYDTIGMTIQKERSDLFRHWILGLGSGDLIVRTSGADAHEFRLNNVLFISKKLQMIEEMQRVRQERSMVT
jgi:hypothetical protein